MSLKFAICLAYYKRPKIVLNALNSIKELKYDNWHLYFVDDSGNEDFKEKLFSFGISKDKITYIPIMDSDEKKISQGGSRHGHFINEAYKNSDCDIGITLCDDDALFADYLNKLNKFYANNDKAWGYCHVKFYNPEKEEYKSAKLIPDEKELNTWTLNSYNVPIYPSCKVDGAQVSFNLHYLRKFNLWYPSPQTRDCDRSMFEKCFPVFGPCHFIGGFGQYKGWFRNQLGYRHKINGNYIQDTSWEKEYLNWNDK